MSGLGQIITFKAANVGRAKTTQPFGLTALNGTTGVGGTAITTASFLYSVARITGTPATGIQLGATLPMHIMPTMGQSTLVMRIWIPAR